MCAGGYYKNYEDALKEVNAKWKLYSGIIPNDDPGLQAKQQSSWDDYRQSLSRHGWQPTSVPARRRAAVVSNVRKKVPVPSNWHPADQLTFRMAVKHRCESTLLWLGRFADARRVSPVLRGARRPRRVR